MTTILLIFLAGGAGTLARFGLASLVQKYSGGNLPLSTVVVNGLGCLLIGVVYQLAKQRDLLGEDYRIVLMVGLLGGFTTFSTFALEAQTMLREERWAHLVMYLLAHNVLGILFVAIGLRLVR